jgi:hypothetical protein
MRALIDAALWQKKWDQSATGCAHNIPTSTLSRSADNKADARPHDELAVTPDLSDRTHEDFDESSSTRDSRRVLLLIALTI